MVEEPEAYGLGPIQELEFQARGVVNTTYRVRLASGETWMLRILPRGLGAQETERAATALAGDAGLLVPRERGRGEVDHPYWIGSWIPGVRLDDWLAGGPPEAERRRVGEAIGRDLAALHAVTFEAPGKLLRGREVRPARGEPVGLQLRRWLGEDRTRASLGEAGVAAVRGAYEARREALVDWASHASLLHGDPGPGNLLVDDDGAVGWVDWEWARAGDPAWDLAILLGREAPGDAAWREGVEAGYGPLPSRERREAYELMLAVEVLKLAISAPGVLAWARARLEELT
jgi:aminoglycoside phosphotransferase (APT) family kinase protein